MTRRPLTLGGIATAALAVTLLAGCTATPSSASAPTPDATPAPTATTPTPEPVAETSPDPAATCDTVLSAEGYQKVTSDGLEPLASPPVVRRARHPHGGLREASPAPGAGRTRDLVLTVVQVGVAPAEEATWSQALDDIGVRAHRRSDPGRLQRPCGCGERHHAGRPAGQRGADVRQLAGLRRTDRAGRASRASCPRRPATPSDRGAAASAARSGCRGGPRGSARTGPPAAR